MNWKKTLASTLVWNKSKGINKLLKQLSSQRVQKQLALANLVKTFEVTPPGHDASIIMPTASSFVMPIKEILKNATVGSKIIWFIIPTKNALGL